MDLKQAQSRKKETHWGIPDIVLVDFVIDASGQESMRIRDVVGKHCPLPSVVDLGREEIYESQGVERSTLWEGERKKI